MTALREIETLRKNKLFKIDTANSNPFKILVKENYGTTAYCFSTPIYNVESKKLVCRKFVKKGKVFVFCGSNSIITVHKNHLVLKNQEGSVSFDIPVADLKLNNGILQSRECAVTPSFNGIKIEMRLPYLKMVCKTDRKLEGVRQCSKSVAIMIRDFLPLFTVSPLISTSENGSVFPAEISCFTDDERNYEIEISSCGGECISFEINLYEPKLFQDTTVESRHPNENNAYGGIAFVGQTPFFGKQWIYLKPDFSKISETYSQNIKKILLHIPKVCGESQLSAFAISSRFCSLGLTWNSRKPQAEFLIDTEDNGKYITADLTKAFCELGQLHYSDGIVLKPTYNSENCTVVSTGDNYSDPVIMEIKY